MQRRSFVTQAAAAAWAVSSVGVAQGASAGPGGDVVLRWNRALIAAIAATATNATIAARAISMVNEAAYNAWCSFHPYSSFSLGGLYRKAWSQHTQANKAVAISQAAYAVALDLFPTQTARFDLTLAQALAGIGLDTPAAQAARAAGQAAANALLAMRHNDGSNQLGNLAPGAYSDTTGYQPVNTPDRVVDPTRWQPLRTVNLQGQVEVQSFLTPHWGLVRPFALPSGSALRPAFGAPAPTFAELDEMVTLSANLDDTTKATVDLWAANPGSVSPPGQWVQVADQLSAGDGNSLDQDMRLFFGLGQAVLDASIACWEAKRAYDSVRPITAIRHYYRGAWVRSWGGPGRGTEWVRAENWMPYQRAIRPSPNFPEFPSGHSTFSHASSTLLAGLRGSDAAAIRFVFPAGAVPFEPTVPAQDVPFNFTTLSATAASAAYSRRLGGIHFIRGDVLARTLGRNVGTLVLRRCQRLFAGG